MMTQFKAKRVKRSCTQKLMVPPEKVFPVLCPVFEQLSPEQHQQFLEFLCIPEDEIRQIRTQASS